MAAVEVVGVYNKREALSEIYHFKYVQERVGRERTAVVMSCRRKDKINRCSPIGLAPVWVVPLLLGQNLEDLS